MHLQVFGPHVWWWQNRHQAAAFIFDTLLEFLAGRGPSLSITRADCGPASIGLYVEAVTAVCNEKHLDEHLQTVNQVRSTAFFLSVS